MRAITSSAIPGSIWGTASPWTPDPRYTQISSAAKSAWCTTCTCVTQSSPKVAGICCPDAESGITNASGVPHAICAAPSPTIAALQITPGNAASQTTARVTSKTVIRAVPKSVSSPRRTTPNPAISSTWTASKIVTSPIRTAFKCAACSTEPAPRTTPGPTRTTFKTTNTTTAPRATPRTAFSPNRTASKAPRSPSTSFWTAFAYPPRARLCGGCSYACRTGWAGIRGIPWAPAPGSSWAELSSCSLCHDITYCKKQQKTNE